MPFKNPGDMKRYQQQWHIDNKTRRMAEAAQRKIATRRYVQELKATLRCVDCGERHPAVLQFHHIRREDKVFSISDAVRTSVSLQRIKDEIKKCIVLCANCHLLRHWKEKRAPDSLAKQFEKLDDELLINPQEQDAYEKVFGTSSETSEEYREYLRYYGVEEKNLPR